MTYLVMECHPAYAIVLDQSGRVIRVANMGYEPGQRLGDVIALRTPPVSLRLRLAPLVAAACLCMAIFGGGTYGAFFFPYGSVRIQINPDVRMSVSYMDRVVGLEGLNEDGARLISQVSYKGKDAVKMSEVLVDRAVDMGYLREGGTVSVKVRGSTRWREKREASITSGLEHMMKGRMDVEIKALSPDTGNNQDTPQGPDSQTGHPSTEDMLPPNYPVAAPATPGEAGWGYWGDDDDDEDDKDDGYDGKLGRDDEDEEEDNDQDDGEEDCDRDGDDGDDGDDGRGRDLDDQDDEDCNRNGDDRAEHDEDKRHEKAEHDEDGGKKPHKVNNDGSMNANGDKEGSALQQSPMQQTETQQTETQQTNTQQTNQKEELENNQNEAGEKEDDRNQDRNDKQDKDRDDSHDQKENEDDGNGGNDDDDDRDEMDDD